VGELPHDGVAGDTLAAAAAAPLVRLDDTTGEERSLRFEPLTRDDEAELIESAERGEVGAAEPTRGSVRHVEVSRMGGVRTPHPWETSTPLRLRRADQPYTLTWEEPVILRRVAFDHGVSACVMCDVIAGEENET
jgi:hypothetical protein